MAKYSSSSMFNPYSHLCSVHDKKSSPAIRKTNLKKYLAAALEENDVGLWVGRDLGYRGGRRTGISLTDEVHRDLIGQTWGIDFKQATATEPQKEKNRYECLEICATNT